MNLQLNISDIPMILSIGCTVFLILQFIIIISLSVSLSKMKKRLKSFLPSDKKMDIENMLVEYSKNSKEVLDREENMLNLINITKENLEKSILETSNKIDDINIRMKKVVQKVSIIRYNPFKELGGDLCYAIALLDEENNGLVINSIYARDACYSYAKEITNGQSLVHKLSEEERQAVDIAMKK